MKKDRFYHWCIKVISYNLPSVIKFYILSMALCFITLVVELIVQNEVTQAFFVVSSGFVLLMAILLSASHAALQLPAFTDLMQKGLENDQLKADIDRLDKQINGEPNKEKSDERADLRPS